ncbi:MAG: dephospho-CoA kinase [Actinobacteria bacterium]|nr:dephospho-CoA kinase [Actinomycetota bacterium]
MVLVGLTGGIGSGKSTVAEMLVERGAVLVDADVVARQVVEPGTPGFDAVVERFGPEVVGPDGALDRGRLADIVFADEGARESLNAITHPRVGEEMMRQVAEAPADAVVIMDVPLLAEGGKDRASGYAAVVVVEAPAEVRLERLVARGMNRGDAEARMARQASDAERREIATHVIDNSGTRADLEAQIDSLWADLLTR